MAGDGPEKRRTGGAGTGVESHPSSGFVPLFVAPSPEELGDSIPQYEILSLLGQGGMGAVYKARQPKLDRFVAIKLLPAQVGNDVPGFAERFDREARAMAQLNHPNIVTVHDYGETEDGHRYIVMEFVEGKDLHAAIASGTLQISDVLAWAPQICAGLDYAHRHHLVHRDIKPANILISAEGQAKVGDFGLAKLVGSSRDLSLTQSQVSLGTPDYAAPEALQPGAEIDHRADIYSFGVVLYQMLTGTVPRGAWKAPSAIRAVDPRLDRIVVKAMQPDPDHRYQRMGQILEALEEIKRVPAPVEPPPAAKVAAASARANGNKRMHPLSVALIAVAGVVLTMGVILMVAADQMGLQGFPRWRISAEKGEAEAPTPRRPIAGNSRPVTPPKQGTPLPLSREAKQDRVPRKDNPPKPPVRSLSSSPRPGSDGWMVLRPPGDLPASVEGLESGLELWPPPPPLGYELRFPWDGQGGKSADPVEIRLPVRDSVALLELGDEKPASVVLRWENRPEIVAVGKAMAPLGEIRVRVVGNGGQVGLQVTQDAATLLTWSGGRDSLPEGAGAADADRRIRFRAPGSLQIPALAFRSLPAEAWLSAPEPWTPPDPLSLLTKPEAPDSAGVSGSLPAPMPVPDPVTTARTTLVARVAELRTRYDGLEAELAVAGYDRKMASLRESYQAALNRSVGADPSLPMEAAVQRELNRIRDREAIEDTDPPELPETVRKLREVFRKESRDLEAELRLATAPILREHLAALQSLVQGPAWQDAALAPAQEPLLEEVRRVEDRLVLLSPAALPTNPTSPVPGPVAPSVPPPALSGSIRLARPAFPPLPAEVRGSVRFRPLKPGVEVPPEVADVPKGLNGNVVDLAAVDGIVAALKSNGRVEIWGSDLTPELAADITRVDRVVRVFLARRGERGSGQIALLLGDGTVHARTLGREGQPATLPDGAGGIDGAVELAVTPDGGVALRKDGTVVLWGGGADLGAGPDPKPLPANLARVRAVGNGLVALAEDGTAHLLGAEDGAAVSSGAEFLSRVGAVQDVWGTGRDGWLRVADGSLRPWGDFAVWAEAWSMGALEAGEPAGAVVVGPGAFALGQASGTWRFAGADLNPGLDAAFGGCHLVAITSAFVVGLGPE